MSEFFILSTLTLFVIMSLGFLLSQFNQTMGTVDLFWGVGISTTGLVLLINSEKTVLQIALVGLVLAWGLRLTLFLLMTRISKKEEDPRYREIQAKWHSNKRLKTLLHFYMQAALQLPICFVFIPIFLSPSESASAFQLGMMGLCFLCILGEGIADQQLFQFKKQGSGGICRTGLWNRSRHPNYFFEILFWIFLALVSLPETLWFWALLSPVSIWVIIRFVTAPYTEKMSLKHRGDAFKQYQKEVPMIFPRVFL